MRIKISKDFQKSVDRLSGKVLNSIIDTLREVKQATSLEEINNCKKLIDYDNVYRIRIGSYRAFFIFHIQIIDDTVSFLYLIPRGEAYSKKTKVNLRRKDV